MLLIGKETKDKCADVTDPQTKVRDILHRLSQQGYHFGVKEVCLRDKGFSVRLVLKHLLSGFFFPLYNKDSEDSVHSL
jgi:hypothetical protein